MCGPDRRRPAKAQLFRIGLFCDWPVPRLHRPFLFINTKLTVHQYHVGVGLLKPIAGCTTDPREFPSILMLSSDRAPSPFCSGPRYPEFNTEPSRTLTPATI